MNFTMDLRAVSDICGHRLGYQPAVSGFPAIPGAHWSRLDAQIKNGGFTNADDLQTTVAVAPVPVIVAGVAEGECRRWVKN